MINEKKEEISTLPIGVEHTKLYIWIKAAIKLMEATEAEQQRICVEPYQRSKTRRNSTRKQRGGGISKTIKNRSMCKLYKELLIGYKEDVIKVQYKNKLGAKTVEEGNKIYEELKKSIKEFESIKHVLVSQCGKTIPQGYDFESIKKAINAKHMRAKSSNNN